jgi:rare lipoprotein A (peptidoglycan hydrolase)
MWAQLRRGLTVTGRATWYGATRGYADVAHVAMAGARYLPRGRSAPRARVCVDGRCAVLPVVDFCGCHVGSGRPRIVDLSAGALRRLKLDPSRGVYNVRVTLVAS